MVTESESHVCSNPICKRSFSDTILIQNLSSDRTTSYHGCPHCLTQTEEKSGSGEEGVVQQRKAQSTQQSSSQKCLNTFGYLSERSKGTEIPEECMMCQKLIGCMLFKLQKPETTLKQRVYSAKAIKQNRKWYHDSSSS